MGPTTPPIVHAVDDGSDDDGDDSDDNIPTALWVTGVFFRSK